MMKQNSENETNLTHDINATLSALLSALELINGEWKSNPELVDRIVPLTINKVELLSLQIAEYRKIPKP
ncbi:MAG: hypothetical protein HOP07_08500 [Bacteriovoracaceae bacterium]|nr:hypothetical protein [Bacteriovoracaceae bacterium]